MSASIKENHKLYVYVILNRTRKMHIVETSSRQPSLIQSHSLFMCLSSPKKDINSEGVTPPQKDSILESLAPGFLKKLFISVKLVLATW